MRYSKQPAMRAMLALLVLTCIDASASASSEATDQPPPLTLQVAVARALANNPGIKAANLDIGIKQARRKTDALPTPYTLNAEVENFGGTDSASGIDVAETTLRVSKVMELGDKRQYRSDLGDARVGLARIEATVRELELTAEVSRQ